MANIGKDREKLYARQLAQAKARSAGGVAGLEMGNRIAEAQSSGSPVRIAGAAASTPSGYLAFNAANDARVAAGQMPLGDANAARAASNVASSASGGAMIPSNAMSSARMQASMPNTGANAFVSPQDAWMNHAKSFASQGASATNQQLQQARQEMGTNQSTSLTQMASQLDPSIRKDAERAREWRIMSPQQRREEVDRLGMEQDARIAGQASTGTWEDRQKYARSLADPTGMFIDSYGRESPMYSPETAERIRSHQRKIEPAIARMMSSYDRTKWDSPQAYLDAASALPEVIEAGEFGKSIVFNIGRKYGTPTMKAQMEAEDRNMKLFEQAGTKKALEEIVQKMAQSGQVSPEYANGYRLTNDGTKELLRQVWLNKDNDPRAGQIVNEIMANAPVMWEERDGRVVPSESHKAMREEAAMRNAAQADSDRKKKEAGDKAEAEKIASTKKREIAQAQIDRVRQMNPAKADNMYIDDANSLVDLNRYAPPEHGETAPSQLTRRQRLGNIADSANARERLSSVQRSAKLAWQYIPSAENPNPPSIDAEIARLQETEPDSPLIGELAKARDELFKYGATQEEVADAIAELEDIIGM
jgi:hypothetical protein